MEEKELLEQKDFRDEVINNIEVLDKVGDLLLLPNTEKATVSQVAKYYNVGLRAITSLIHDNYDEVSEDGYKVYKGKELSTSHVISFKEFTSNRANYTFTLDDNEDLKVGGKGIGLFTKRAILRVGMLLRDSEIAKEVRTRLLDIVQDIGKENPEVIDNIVNEINEEKQLMLSRVEAEMRGDYPKVCEINSKLFALKNKRIKELEDTNKTITTNALTILESRDVINKLVRTIAKKEYSGKFGIAYSDLYSKVNYKLGINIKSRNKKKNESYLNTLTEQETFDTEQIVRSWAVDEGLDVASLLKLGKNK